MPTKRDCLGLPLAMQGASKVLLLWKLTEATALVHLTTPHSLGLGPSNLGSTAVVRDMGLHTKAGVLHFATSALDVAAMANITVHHDLVESQLTSITSSRKHVH